MEYMAIGQYLRDTRGKVADKKTCKWLIIGKLKKKTEAFILAAQDQALHTWAICAQVRCTGNCAKTMFRSKQQLLETHKIETVFQSSIVKILWDFKILIDKHSAHNVPDISVVMQQTKQV